MAELTKADIDDFNRRAAKINKNTKIHLMNIETGKHEATIGLDAVQDRAKAAGRTIQEYLADSGWRMPTASELHSLFKEQERAKPADPTAKYWTPTAKF